MTYHKVCTMACYSFLKIIKGEERKAIFFFGYFRLAKSNLQRVLDSAALPDNHDEEDE